MATGLQLVAAAKGFLGFPYTTRRPINCSSSNKGIDCSALIVCSARSLGVTKVATNSSGLAIQSRDAHLLVSVAVAMRTPGALLFWGPNKGYWGFGPMGHVAICVGDGVHLVEARGKKWGCVIGTLANRPGPSNAGFLPGIDYSTHPAPVPTPAPNPTPTTPIAVRDDMPQLLEQPIRTADDHRDPLAPQIAVLEKRRVVLLHGASVAGDHQDGNHRIRDLPTPSDLIGWLPLPPGAPGLPGGGPLGGFAAINADGNPYHISWS